MGESIHLALTGEDNEIRHDNCDFENVRLDIIGDGNSVVFGRYASLRDTTLTIRGNGHKLHIGARCEIEALNLRLLHRAGVFALGDDSFVLQMTASVLEGTRCVIGRQGLISRGVVLTTGDAHSILDAATGARLNPSADVAIGDHVWLGEEAMILKGARIGSNCVIGARSLVTGSIAANCLAAGNPARVLRENITWSGELVPLA